MEFGFTEEQEKLRKEVRDFYINELPEDCLTYMSPLSKELQSFWMQLQKKAGAKGYLTPGWSKETGGLGLSPIEQGVVEEEWGRVGAMWPNFSGLGIAGPAVQVFGTPEQKRKFLPPIARGETVWNQAFTEPNAGSDEANIQLRAVKDGDDYILNGQKTFISHIYQPDYLYTLVRTEDSIPKHRGISLFLVPADTPGITFRPLPTMGFGIQNEIFFDDVRVSKDYLLGELNKGFYHAMSAFEFERSGTASPARARRNLEDFVQFCKKEKRNGKPLIEDPDVRKMLAQMTCEVEIYRLIAWQAVWWFSRREKLGPKPYDLTGFFTKIFTTRHAEAMMNVMGLYGQLKDGSKKGKRVGRGVDVEGAWQTARSLHAGGTIEVYKIVLAQRGLGLPRAPRAAARTS
jgi:alkylation response protein AidB-like acyl-CoA dehydrogenase